MFSRKDVSSWIVNGQVMLFGFGFVFQILKVSGSYASIWRKFELTNIGITSTIGTKNRATKYVGFLNRKVSYTKIKKELLTSTEQNINRKKIEKEEKSLSSRGD